VKARFHEIRKQKKPIFCAAKKAFYLQRLHSQICAANLEIGKPVLAVLLLRSKKSFLSATLPFSDLRS
jgi:hypothetical protein